ncbi:MAG TPA: alkaline phosphatase PhoX [Rhizomicrobium sp.]|nr:alkaline phosphatase PhoX [Rhizomicrobium sp.]
MSSESEKIAPKLDRRALFRGGAALALSVPFQNMMIRQAQAAGPIVSPYGAIAPVADHNTGLNLLQLPSGFEYWSFSWTGDAMTNGTPTPGAHDGMAVVRTLGNGRKCVLVRNHEQSSGVPFASGPLVYSPDAAGGTTNLIWDTKTKRLEKVWPTLSGTVRNCSGGKTPWNSWITSEETFSTTNGGNTKHGYNFDIPAGNGGANNAKPIIGMGRFAHEGCCIDPTNYYIYETEDGPSVAGEVGSGFYRFIPRVFGPNGRPMLRKGGTLQMLRIVGEPQKNMQFLGVTTPPTVYDTTWVDVPNPDPNPPAEQSCFMQGYSRGGAAFRRLEGVFYSDAKIYFTSTDGGPIAAHSTSGEGQVWEYDPINEKLRIIYHSADQADCENPDNIVVTPNGALILCEDNSGSTSNDAERLLGVTLAGEIFTFAKNNLNFTVSGLGNYIRPESGITYSLDYRQQEWAGATFSPDGKYLFVNTQTPGITYAITGPWANGPF